MLYFYSGETAATSGDIRSLLNDDSVFVADTALLIAQAGTVFRLAGRNRVSISGEIVANVSAIVGATTSEYNDVRILAGGSVFSATGYAVTLAGAGNHLINAGTLDGSSGVSLTGQGSSITNSGTILAELEAVTLGAASNTEGTLNNSGLIVSSSTGNAIRLRGTGTFSMVNSGTITSTYGNAIDLTSTTGALTLTNTGTIHALNIAVYTDSSADTVYNSGTIAGDIRLLGGDDRYFGTGGIASNLVSGGAGDDMLVGGDARDWLDGGDDDDEIDGAGGNDLLIGNSGDDTIDGGDGNDVLIGGDGIDTLDGGAGRDTASYRGSASGVVLDLANGALNTGEAAGDSFTGIEVYQGGAFGDAMSGSAAAETFQGGASADTLDGRDGNDLLLGQDGDDVLIGGLGNDRLRGGDGIDTASYAAATGLVRVNLSVLGAQNTAGAGIDSLDGIENLIGSAFADVLTGDDLDNAIDGGDGGDTITGGKGDDLLTGGLGDDRLTGGDGIDTVSYVSATAGITLNLGIATAQATGGAGADTVAQIENVLGSAFADVLTGSALANVLTGGAGNDQLVGGDGDDVLIGGADNDTLTGGIGTDTADYALATAGVTVRLATLTAQNTGGAGIDTLGGIENLVGSAFNDQLIGDSAANVLEGGVGNDLINGSSGLDTATYRTASGAVTVDLRIATAQNTVSAGLDQLVLIESLTGSAFGDTLTGTDTLNRLEGLDGDDILTALAGNDTLVGGLGDDTLFGGADNDTLIGGAGNNIIDGGDGFDTVSYVDSPLSVYVIFDTANPYALDYSSFGDELVGIEAVIGSAFDDGFRAGFGEQRFTGGLGADGFAFIAGQAQGDTLVGFSGTGGQGDSLFFEGYGPGATFTQIDATHWQVSNAAATIVETITFVGGTLIVPATDVVFG